MDQLLCFKFRQAECLQLFFRFKLSLYSFSVVLCGLCAYFFIQCHNTIFAIACVIGGIAFLKLKAKENLYSVCSVSVNCVLYFPSFYRRKVLRPRTAAHTLFTVQTTVVCVATRIVNPCIIRIHLCHFLLLSEFRSRPEALHREYNTRFYMTCSCHKRFAPMS